MKIKVLVSIFSLVAMIVTATFFVENRYALSAEVQKIEKRLDYKILMDQYRAIRERVWALEDRHGKNLESSSGVSLSTKEMYRELKDDMKLLQDGINFKKKGN